MLNFDGRSAQESVHVHHFCKSSLLENLVFLLRLEDLIILTVVDLWQPTF